MNRTKICIFGGTTEGRLIAEFLSCNKISADLFIATEYGKQFVKNLNHINVYQVRLDKMQMIRVFTENKYDLVIDATHPYAKIVTENIRKASDCCNIRNMRVIRKTSENLNCSYFENVENCIEYLNNTEGNILLTTGSKDLEKFTAVKNYSDRIYVRILPMTSSLKKAVDLGFLNKNIICIQGPFCEQLNSALINSTNSKFVVTKDSSESGGFEEKVRACINTNSKCLVIRKPDENGLTLEEVYYYLKLNYSESLLK